MTPPVFSRSHPPRGLILALRAPVLALCSIFVGAAPASAQTVYAFADESVLTVAMLRLAALTTGGMTVPDPCRLYIVTVAGGRELFRTETFDAMNRVLARAVVGRSRMAECEIRMHELTRDGADGLLASLGAQKNAFHVLETLYISSGDRVAAYAAFRDGKGRTLGQSGRFDLPVAASAAPPATANPAPLPALKPEPEPEPKPKETTKLLTEVHFDPGSANITYVGAQKIQKAIEAIRKQNPREVRILGFTDTKGSADVNKAFATARAQNVAQALREAGLNVQFVVEGRGEGSGPYQTPDGVSEPLNRCVGIIAVGGGDGAQ